MNVQNLRGWLLQLPKPALVRCTVNGETEELKPGKSWQRLAESIAALDPEQVTALDAEGKILRAVRMDDSDARRSDAAAVPEALKVDPQALMLTHFANLIHRAYEHSTETAFTKMVELVDRMNDRSQGIEERLERAEARSRRLQDEAVSDAYERAEELAAQAVAGGDKEALGLQMLNMFMQGRGGVAPAAAAAAANGAAKPNGKGVHA